MRLRLLPMLLCPMLMGNATCPGSAPLLASYGYTPLRPPSNLLGVGAMVVIESSDPFQARVICGPEASLGPHMQVSQSRTASAAVRRLDGQSYQMDVGAWDQLKQNGRFSSVKSVTMTLQNPSILELRDEDVLAGMAERSPACARAIAARVEAGYTVTMISSALRADVIYQVGFEASQDETTSHAATPGVLGDLAATLGGHVSASGETSVRSEGLIFGIRDDEYLSALSIEAVDHRSFKPGTRHLGQAGVLTVPDPTDSALGAETLTKTQ